MTPQPVPSIEVVPYDPTWPAAYQRARQLIMRSLPEAEVHHVGSTSVPGLVSKPTIDVMVCMPESTPSDRAVTALESIGYEFRPHSFADSVERHLFLRDVDQGRRRQHLHVVDLGSDLARDYLAFRDYLRTHSAVAADYATAKLRLLEESNGNRAWYVDHKVPVVDTMMDSARRWYTGDSR